MGALAYREQPAEEGEPEGELLQVSRIAGDVEAAERAADRIDERQRDRGEEGRHDQPALEPQRQLAYLHGAILTDERVCSYLLLPER